MAGKQSWFELSDEEVDTMKCDDLRRTLGYARQPTSGRKAELQLRLKEAIAEHRSANDTQREELIDEDAQSATEQDTPMSDPTSSSLSSSSNITDITHVNNPAINDAKSDDLTGIAESHQTSNESSNVSEMKTDHEPSEETDTTMNDEEMSSKLPLKKRKRAEAESTDSSESLNPTDTTADPKSCASNENAEEEKIDAIPAEENNIGEQSSIDSNSDEISESTAVSAQSAAQATPVISDSTVTSTSSVSTNLASSSNSRRPGSAESSSKRRGSRSPTKGRVFRQKYTDIRDYLGTLEDEQLRELLLNVIDETGFSQTGLACSNAEEFIHLALHPTCIELSRNITGQDVFTALHRCMNTDTTLNKIFLRKLSYDTKDSTLERVFSKFGRVKEVCIVKEKESGRSRGFGFVIMSSAEEATKALAEYEKIIDGKTVICNLASKPQGTRTFPMGEAGPHGKRGGRHRKSGHRNHHRVRRGY